MRQVIFNYYVNEFWKYLSFSQRVLHSVLRGKGEKCGNITTHCTKETCISRKNHGKVKEKQTTSKKENCFRITTLEIRAQIRQIIVSWRYCQFLGRCRANNRSRPFLYIISNFFNEQKSPGPKFHSSQSHPSSRFLWI